MVFMSEGGEAYKKPLMPTQLALGRYSRDCHVRGNPNETAASYPTIQSF
jgi:hypothetical protein